ncbi:MAG: hypothetical protein P1P74_03935 [Desulfuromonadales bacterium]|nr:hypothetical protein [Desulfuromonadales bacterium]
MAAVFNAPVVAVGAENFVGVGFFWRATGHTVSSFGGHFPGFFNNAFAFDDESLTDPGEVEIVVELGRCPDLACFNATVAGINTDCVRLIALLEIEDEIREQTGLIPFAVLPQNLWVDFRT